MKWNPIQCRWIVMDALYLQEHQELLIKHLRFHWLLSWVKWDPRPEEGGTRTMTEYGIWLPLLFIMDEHHGWVVWFELRL